MSHALPATSENVSRDLHALVTAIEGLPAAQAQILAPLAERVVAGAQRRRKILDLVQDALSQLRLDMKYLIFDLESTRRERDQFKQLLDDLHEGN